MPRGGARNRSGPQPDKDSARSDRRGYKLTALPSEGYQGHVPNFPLPRVPVYVLGIGVGGKPVKIYDEDATGARRERELELWEWLWRTPQACAWSMPSERWRFNTIALYTRTFVICEGPDATAADKNSLHRFADQIGMTTAGLAEMGWAVAVDEVAEQRESHAGASAKPKSSRGRMRVVGGSDG